MRYVECVPNFSEGRDLNIINQIVDAIKTKNVTVLDVDPGAATNRTVVTIVGEPEDVVEAAFEGIKKAGEVIDMSKHSGAHARMGATDVCPFIPISGVTETECIELAKKLGKRVGEELNIPVYLYEKAASTPDRVNLAHIRAGEYEGFFEKIKKAEWKPDFGPAEFNKKSGGTVIGVREFLIAYNINLNTRNTLIARKIANRLREKGYPKRDKNGKLLKDENGKKVLVPGLFKDVKAVGWYIDEYKRAQISINLTNYKVSPPHKVFDVACELAQKFGARVTGSELVGLIPKEAIYEAGIHYLKKSKSPYGLSEREIIETAIQSLGLAELSCFDIDEKIIEYRVEKDRPLINMTIKEFINELASNSPAPGGGSVAALSGALSAGLVSMVGNLTEGKFNYKKVKSKMHELSYNAQLLKKDFLNIIDDDTDSFNELMDSFALPKSTDIEKKFRDIEIEKSTKKATLIPFSALKKVPETLKLSIEAAKDGNQSALSDAGVSGLMGKAAAYGAYYNVLINLADIKDQEFVERLKKEGKEIIDEVDKLSDEIQNIVLSKLN